MGDLRGPKCSPLFSGLSLFLAPGVFFGVDDTFFYFAFAFAFAFVFVFPLALSLERALAVLVLALCRACIGLASPLSFLFLLLRLCYKQLLGNFTQTAAAAAAAAPAAVLCVFIRGLAGSTTAIAAAVAFS